MTGNILSNPKEPDPRPRIVIQFADAARARQIYPETLWTEQVPGELLAILNSVLTLRQFTEHKLTYVYPNLRIVQNWEPSDVLFSFVRLTVNSFDDADTITQMLLESKDSRIATAYVEGEVTASLELGECPATPVHHNIENGGIGSDLARHVGLDGRGEVLGLLDQGWNTNHPSLGDWKLIEVFGKGSNACQGAADHGLCTLGVIGARTTLLTGVAPGVTAALLAAARREKDNDMAGAALIALTNSLQERWVPECSVVLIESCYMLRGGVQLPLESDLALAEQLRKIVDLGHVLVVAAGNGYRCIDYHLPLGDIGSIRVGACAVPKRGTFYKRISSNFSLTAQVHAFSWGENVLTAGCVPGGRFSTACWGDTSAASAVVAGACLVAQQKFRAAGTPLNGRAMRKWIMETGVSCSKDQGIGHQPNLKQLISTQNYIMDKETQKRLMMRDPAGKSNWPPERPYEKGFRIPPFRESPTLPDDPNEEEKKAFAAEAFGHFAALIIEEVKRINSELKRYHDAKGTPHAQKKYREAIEDLRHLIEEPKVLTNTPFHLEDLDLKMNDHNDYCLGFTIRGWVVFQADAGPGGESSSSSSSHAILPPAWP